jgi:hypothetical protein
MIRRTGWRWRGDYFDPEQPYSIELHFRFWNPAAECISVDGLDDLWRRRTTRNIGPCEIPRWACPIHSPSLRYICSGTFCAAISARIMHTSSLISWSEALGTAPSGASGRTLFPFPSRCSRPYRFGLLWNGSTVGRTLLFYLLREAFLPRSQPGSTYLLSRQSWP